MTTHMPSADTIVSLTIQKFEHHIALPSILCAIHNIQRLLKGCMQACTRKLNCSCPSTKKKLKFHENRYFVILDTLLFVNLSHCGHGYPEKQLDNPFHMEFFMEKKIEKHFLTNSNNVNLSACTEWISLLSDYFTLIPYIYIYIYTYDNDNSIIHTNIKNNLN